MKLTVLKSFIACLTLVAILLVSTACSPTTLATTTASSQPTSPAAPTQSPTSTMVLPAEKLKQWEDRGFYNADTIEEASQVAGYNIATPAFVPEGFTVSSTWRVTRLGAGLPENLRPKFTQINVDQDWAMDRSSPSSPSLSSFFSVNMFILSQSTHQFGIGDDSEAVVIAGQTGQRILTPADGDQPAKLTLGWSDGTRWYSLNGTLNEDMDEATLMKIAESVGVK